MKRSELFSRILISLGLILLLSVPFIARNAAARGIIEIHARMAGAGGWMPSVIQAQVGVPLHLRLTSDDVTHGFAVGQMVQPSMDVLPGKMTDVTLMFDKPGSYTFYCTRWCGPDHWRMRGTIQVSGSSPEPTETASSPLYTQLGLDIDAAHPAIATPAGTPSAERGAGLAARIPSRYLAPDYYFSHSPAQVFQDLRGEAALQDLSDSSIWDAVANIWQTNVTPVNFAEGKKLYAQNCAACHGETGGGNGVFASNVKALAGKTPANFGDPASLLGAAPALLQGKILRGGMGTGMPAWGPILTSQQTWDLVSYLYSWQFEEKNK